jgi:hypothetical protein
MLRPGVLRVLTFLMAETLPAGSEAVEILGHLLTVDMKEWWTPDEAFLDLLRDKPAINAMLAELAGKLAAHIHVAETATVQKGAISIALPGLGDGPRSKAGCHAISVPRCSPTPSARGCARSITGTFSADVIRGPGSAERLLPHFFA